MKVYLAGPMTGIPFFNFPLFHKVATRLRDQGHEVFNPAERDIVRHNGTDISNAEGDPAKAARDHGFSLREALAEDTAYICNEATAICMLPGWESSAGARAEHALAACLKHTIMYHIEDTPPDAT
jgi:Domain of unknown function (DUF4406)